MNLYTDTSALAKKYIRETGSAQIISLFSRDAIIGVSTLGHVEMASAMSKALRMKWVNEVDISAAWQEFLQHWPAYFRIPVSATVLDRAAGLSWRRGLRAYDAVHLASALSWKDISGEDVTFACFDKNLQSAAKKEGLPVWPET